MARSLVCLTVLLCSSAGVLAENRISSDAAAGNAPQICQTGKGTAYGHPSNACWVAHEDALTRNDSARALAYMKLSCKNYQRSDHCLLVKLEKKEQRQRGAIRAATAQDRVEGASRNGTRVERASRAIASADHEDGEAGVIFYELLRTGVLRNDR
jgi:hypothetical protein